MAPTYSRGNCTDDGAKEGVTFSVGTSSVLKNGPTEASLPKESATVMTASNKTKSDYQTPEEILYRPLLNNKCNRKVILLSRHGESENNFLGKIGGDTNLSSRGRSYAVALANYVNSLDFQCPVDVWTSGLKRTQQTAAGVKCNQRKAVKELNELHAGCCEGMSYEEIQLKYPLEFAMRDQNKLAYKYPNGESYEDVLARVGPIIKKLEECSEKDEQKVLLIVSHQAVLRCILSHFLGLADKDLPYIQVPLHTVIWLVQDDETGKWSVSHVRLPVECVDTFRPRPKNCTLQRSESDALETVPTHY